MRIVSRKKRLYQESKNHTTYYNKKGEIVPSVTTVLKTISKDNLIYWANNLGWKRKSVKRELDDSSFVGTMAHLFIENILLDKEFESTLIKRDIMGEPDYIKEQIDNSVNSFKLWWDKNKDDFKIKSCEQELVCDEYGGTLDIIAEYKGKPVILDIKTSKSFYFTMFLQLAAYAHMYKVKYGKMPKDVAILRVDKTNGKEAELLWLSDLPGGDIDFYYISYKRALDLFSNIHVLEQDWAEIK